MVGFLEGLEANPQWWEGGVRAQMVADKGDKFSIQKAVFMLAPTEGQKSGQRE